jgi:AraC-like DNA-binding protein
LAGSLNELIESPNFPNVSRQSGFDILSDVLATVRLSGSLQFCLMPAGAWRTDTTTLEVFPSNWIPFHVVVEGTCWLKTKGHELRLAAGDVIALPFDIGHQLGVGTDGRLIVPLNDLPPKPWRQLPVLQYGREENVRTRLLCGYLQCPALGFRPLRDALPPFIHVQTQKRGGADWFSTAIAQMATEVDQPRAGGLSMLERLTEIIFIELLRHQMIAAKPGSIGWLAAIGDPSLGRCLHLIHEDPRREWSVQDLSAASGLSRSTLMERFESILKTSPKRYLRDWRLYLASVALSTTMKRVGVIAVDAGYGTEAAFNRAFSRAFGAPPVAWRQRSRRGQA